MGMRRAGMSGVVCASLMCGCDRPRDVEVRVVARDARGHEVRCGTPTALSSERTISLDKLRFYVHDVAFRDARGRWVKPGQPEGLQHVGQGVWLVDLDDAQCDPEFSPQVHRALPMSLPRGTYDAMRFNLGVPESLNHNDPLAAPPHLALTSMHWGWQAGYRFFRLDGELDDGVSYAVHLGSTRCTGEVGREISCARANRATFVLEGAWFATSDVAHLNLDVAALLKGVDWQAPQGCMGNAEEGDCERILGNLGLNPETGAPVESVRSQVFTSDEGRAP